MVAVNAVIRVDIDASAANAGLASMAAQMQKFNKGMVDGSASMAAAQVAAARRAQGALNRTGQWVATTGSMMTAAGRMHKQFDKGTMASWQQWRDTSKKMTRTLGDQSVMHQMAAQRVRALQTQYVALGKEVDGTQRIMKAQPTGMLRQWGAEAEFAHQKSVLLNRRMQMGANSMINWGKNTQWAGRQMMVGMGIPIGLAAVGAVKAFKDIETASISFKRVYGDATTSAGEKAQMLSKIQTGVAQDMTKYGIAAADTIDVAARAAATGQKGEALVTSTRETMRLATLGQMDYMTALESTIATQTAFGVSSKGMTRVTDFLNAAENQTVLSMGDMAKAIPRVAPVIKGLGGDVEDLGVLMTALRAGGVTAEQGANALKSGLASLINPTSSAVESLNNLGIPIEKIVKANKGDLIGTVQSFGKAINALPKFERQQALESLFGKYQFARMGALFRNINSKQAQETAKLSRASSANLAKMSEQELSQISDSTMNKFQGAIERLKAAAAPLGEAVLGSLAPFVDGAAKIVGFFADNEAARNVLLFGTAFAGLAGVVTMVGGVFANFFGTMTKGYLAMKNFGRKIMGKPSLGYQSIDELEAAAAQKQLAAAAMGASNSLFAEAGAASQLAAALNAMNMELRETVGLQGAATGTTGKRPTAGGAVPVKPTAPTPTPAPRIVPSISPGGPTQRDLTRAYQRTHVGPDGIILTQKQIDSMQKSGSAAVKQAASTMVAGKSMGYSGRTMLLPADLNQYWNDVSKEAPKALAATALHTAGPSSLEPMFKMMGLDTSSPEIQRRAQAVHEEVLRGISAQPGATISQVKLGEHLDNAMNKVFASDPKILEQYARTGLLNAVDTPQGRKVVTGAAGGSGLPFYQAAAGGNARKILSSGQFANLGNTPGAIAATQSIVGAAAGAAGGLNAVAAAANAAAGALGGKAGAASKSAMMVGPDGKAYPVAKVAGLPKVGGPSSRLDAFSPVSSRWYDPAASQRAQQAHQRLTAMGSVARASGGSGYSGFMSQSNQRALAGNLLGSKAGMMGGALGGIFSKGNWNSLRAGGAFGGGTRGMTPEQKMAFNEQKQGRLAGMSNKLFGLGMAADAVTMGLTMSGKELPGFAHAIGPAAMTLGMVPEAITGVISAMGPLAVAGAGLAALVGGAVLSYNYMEEQGRKSGIALGNFAVATTTALAGMEETYGTTSLYSEVMNRRAAKAAKVDQETLSRAQEVSQSEYGKGLSQSYSDALTSQGADFANSSLANTLATGILQKVITSGDAKALTSTLVGGLQGEDVLSDLQSIVGPGGRLINKDPFGFVSQSLSRGLEMAKSQSAVAAQDVGEFTEGVSSEDIMAATRGQVAPSGFVATGMEAIDTMEGNAKKAEAEGYSAQLWSNTMASAYQNKIAAEERLRIAIMARDQAETGMKQTAKQYGKDSKEYAEAAKNYQRANNIVQTGQAGQKSYGDQLSAGMSLNISEFAKMGTESQQQMYDTGWEAIQARYMNDPARLSMALNDKALAQAAIASAPEGQEQAALTAGYGFQSALSTGMAPGDLGKFMAIANQGGKTTMFDQLSSLGNLSNLGATGEQISDFTGKIGQLTAGAPEASRAMMEITDAKGLDNFNQKLGAFSNLSGKLQKQNAGNFLGASPEEIRSWGKEANNAANAAEKFTKTRSAAASGVGEKPGAKTWDPTKTTPTVAPKTKSGAADGAKYGKSFVGSAAKVVSGATNALKFKPTTAQAQQSGQAHGKSFVSGVKSNVSQAASVFANVGKSSVKAITTSKAAIGSLSKSISGVASKVGGKSQSVKVDFKAGKVKPPKVPPVKITFKAAKIKPPKVPPVKITFKPAKVKPPKVAPVKLQFKAGKAPKPTVPPVKLNYTAGKIPPIPPGKQTINRTVGSDESTQTPPPLPQIITRVMLPGNTLTIPPALPQMINRIALPGNTMVPPPPVTQLVIRQTVGGNASGGPIHGYAGGGNVDYFPRRSKKIIGPGGPTGDKIPSMLSDGEYVVRASAVDKYGTGLLDAINSKTFASGGLAYLAKGTKGKDKDKDSGGDDDKDKGWKDFTKEIRKLSSAWNKARSNMGGARLGAGGSPAAMAALLGTDSPNAIRKFFSGGGKKATRQVKKQGMFENAKTFYDQFASDEKAVLASKARVVLASRKKNKISQALLDASTDEEVLALKQLKLKGGQLKRWKNNKDKLQQAEVDRIAREEKAGQDARTQASRAIGSAGMEMSDEEAKRYQALGKGKRAAFEKQIQKRYQQRQAFEARSTFFSRMDDLQGQQAYANRFSNPAFRGLSSSARANLSEEDFATMLRLSGEELRRFQRALNSAAAATQANADQQRRIDKRKEYTDMSKPERYQELGSLFEQGGQAIKDQMAAQGEAKIQNALGVTVAQAQAFIQQQEAKSSAYQHEQELAQRNIDDINKAYDKQAKLLDNISESQQFISTIMRGRMSVASALSSGDIAAAAAAAQEARATEAQVGLDMMKSAIDKEREDKIQKQQDNIDAAQKQIDAISDQIFKFQNTMDKINADAAVLGAQLSRSYDLQLVSLKTQSGYWESIINQVKDYIELMKDVDPNLVGKSKPKPPTKKPAGETPEQRAERLRREAEEKRRRDAQAALDARNRAAEAARERRAKDKAKVVVKAHGIEAKLNKKTTDLTKLVKQTEGKGDDAKSKKIQNKAKFVGKMADKVDRLVKEDKLGRAQKTLVKIDKKKKDILGDIRPLTQQTNKRIKEQKKKEAEEAKKDKPKKKAFGGFVGGYGNTDKVPHLLTPGEFVMTKGSASRYGKALEKVNSSSFKFSDPAGTYAGGSAMGGNIYNLTVNAKTNADANDIATMTIRRIQDMDRKAVRGRMVHSG